MRYAVFGSGNRQWARTYQAIPKRVDAALEAAGATRFRPRGETDAGGDFFGGFDAWYAGLWADLGQALGKTALEQTAHALQVDIVPSARLGALRLTELDQGHIVDNRELVDMSAPFARSKRHIEIALPDGMRYRTGDYLAVLPRNPAAQVERVLRRFGLASDTQVVIGQRPGSASSLPSGYPVPAGAGLTRLRGTGATGHARTGRAAGGRHALPTRARGAGNPGHRAGLY